MTDEPTFAQGLAMLLFVSAIPGSLLLFWFVRPRILRLRRSRLRSQPVPDGMVSALSRNVRLYRVLPPQLRDELHGLMQVFLSEKRFVGCAGFTITPEVRYTIAGTACLLLLNRDTHFFAGFSTILVYPDTFASTEVSYDGDVEIHERTERAGESWHRGPVILSWGDVQRGSDAEDGFNVVLHEFAHKLDEENGEVDGLPLLWKSDHAAQWAAVFGREYAALEESASSAGDAVIDAYGLSSPAEFFAVATESFFEKAEAMQDQLPELYEQLQHFYAVDPARWRREA